MFGNDNTAQSAPQKEESGEDEGAGRVTEGSPVDCRTGMYRLHIQDTGCVELLQALGLTSVLCPFFTLGARPVQRATLAMNLPPPACPPFAAGRILSATPRRASCLLVEGGAADGWTRGPPNFISPHTDCVLVLLGCFYFMYVSRMVRVCANERWLRVLSFCVKSIQPTDSAVVSCAHRRGEWRRYRPRELPEEERGRHVGQQLCSHVPARLQQLLHAPAAEILARNGAFLAVPVLFKGMCLV